MFGCVLRRWRRRPLTFVDAVIRRHGLARWWRTTFTKPEQRAILERAESVYRQQMQLPGHVWMVPPDIYDAARWVADKLSVRATRELGLRWALLAVREPMPEPHDELGSPADHPGLVPYRYYDQVLLELKRYARMDPAVQAEYERVAALQVEGAADAKRALVGRWHEVGAYPLAGGHVHIEALTRAGKLEEAELVRRQLAAAGWLGFSDE